VLSAGDNQATRQSLAHLQKLKSVLELQHSDSFRHNTRKTPKNAALATGFNLPVVPPFFSFSAQTARCEAGGISGFAFGNA
jgi:hypothetical protein